MTNSKKLRLNVTYGLKLIVVILALACCGYAHSPVKSAPKPTRDWTRYPAVIETWSNQDFAAISDPHGDFDRLYRVLMVGTGFVPSEGQPRPIWTDDKNLLVYPGSILIVVGDLINGGSDSLKVIQFLRALQKNAYDRGGQVIVTMGNHEAEFLANWNNNHAEKFRAELTAAGLNPQSVANCQGELGQWLCNLPLAVRVNDWFFCHAGYTKGRTIAQLNSDIARSFNDERENGFKAREITKEHSILTARLDNRGPGGMPWFKDGDGDAIPAEVLRRYARALGVNHIVQGHKPGNVDFPVAGGPDVRRQKEEMFQAYNGLLFLIDADMSGKTEDSDSIGAALYVKGVMRQFSDQGGKEMAFVNCPNPNVTKLLWDISKQEAFKGVKCTIADR